LLYGGFPYPGPNKRQLCHLVREGGARAYERLDEVFDQFFGCGVIGIVNTVVGYDWQHTSTLFLVFIVEFHDKYYISCRYTNLCSSKNLFVPFMQPTVCATKESAEFFVDDVKEVMRIFNEKNNGIVSPLDICEEVGSVNSCKITVAGKRRDGRSASIEFKLVLPIWIFDSISNYEVLDINEGLYIIGLTVESNNLPTVLP
jgi:hypothetical protein